MWVELDGFLIPESLHDKDVDMDHEALDIVAKCLLSYRKVEPVLERIQELEWHCWSIVWPALEASFHGRKGCVAMMMNDEWWPFWNNLLHRYVQRQPESV